MEGNIELRYSTDSGTTWLPSSGFNTFFALRVHSYLRREEQQSTDELDNADKTICAQSVARLIVVVDLDTKQFNPDLFGTTADAAYRYINKLRCADKINLRISATTTREFMSVFNDTGTTPNVNYLVPEDVPDLDFDEYGERKHVFMTLKAVKSYDIST